MCGAWLSFFGRLECSKGRFKWRMRGGLADAEALVALKYFINNNGSEGLCTEGFFLKVVAG